MTRRLIRRVISVILSFSIVFEMLPMSPTVALASIDGVLSDQTIGLREVGDGAEWTAGGTSIQGTANGGSGCSAEDKTGTLYIKNNKEVPAQLSFAYQVDIPENGYIKIDGTSVLEDGEFPPTVIPAGSEVSIEIHSPKEKIANITIESIILVADTTPTISFVAGENGSYTVNDVVVETDGYQATQKSTIPYSLNAIPDEGYKFVAWYSDQLGVFSSDSNVQQYFETDQTVYPLFIEENRGIFDVAGLKYADLNEAVSSANSRNISTIVLVESGVLPAGEYVIPSGKTLLIPFDDAHTLCTTSPQLLNEAHVTPSAYVTLSMEEGSSIRVENGAAISVGSKLTANGTGGSSWNGTPTGKHGRIDMLPGSTIELDNGGNLYAYGYISGDGSVVANAGSTVYECFQMRSWRGGSATTRMKNQSVFPVSQYYVQNVEVPMTLMAGATEIVYTGLTASGITASASAEFIGDNGMFNPKGSITKRYDGTEDRLVFDVEGDAELKNLSLSAAGFDLNTKSYVLPINNNITINVNSGTTSISDQSVALLPSAELNIAEDATVELGEGCDVFVYDKNQWGAYAVEGGKIVTVGYSTVNGTKAIRNGEQLENASIDINGKIDVKGALYTTLDGASIISSLGLGSVVLSANPGSKTTTQQATQSGTNITYVDIPVTPAKLQNADGSFYETADKTADTVIPYSVDRWGNDLNPITVTFNKNAVDATGSMDDLVGSAGKELVLAPNAFQREGYTFTGWTKNSDGTGDVYGDSAKTTFNENVTLYAKWEINEYTIRFLDELGAELKSSELKYGEEIVVPEALSKENTAQYTYTFDGWYGEDGSKLTEGATVSGDATYTAKFRETVNKYTVKFVDEDGTELQSSEVEYGSVPAYTGQIPSKDADAQYTYEFKGWDSELVAVTGEATYTATYGKTTNKYKITFVNEDGTELQSGDVEYGIVPVYTGATPTKEADAQNTYEFKGWDHELAMVTGEATYTATYTASPRTYTVTFKNGDDVTTNEYEYGATITVPENPTKEADEQYVYSFDGWFDSKGVKLEAGTTVTGDAEYVAQFSMTTRTYKVIWVDDDGVTELKTDEVEYGTLPVYEDKTHQTPTKAATDSQTFEFAGWSPAPAPVNGPVTYKATYSASDKLYTVIWLDDDGKTELKRAENITFNNIPVYEDDAHETPTKETSAQYSYTFKEWAKTLDPESLTYYLTAVYDETVNKYTVTFMNGDVEVSSQDLEYGTAITAPSTNPTKEADAQYTYAFNGWYADDVKLEAGTTVSGNITYTARYDAAVKSYKITFADEDGTTVLDSKMVVYGEMPVYAGAEPTKAETLTAAYTFASWTPELAPVTGEATYTAVYNENIKNGWVKWQGNTYFIADGEPVKGLYDATAEDGSHEGTFVFDSETGVFLSDQNGVYQSGDDYYYTKDGEVEKNVGLTRIEDEDGTISYYYFGEDGKAYRDGEYNTTKHNGYLLKDYRYRFGVDGVIDHDPDTSKNGICEGDGSLFYYVDGVKVPEGLMKIDGNYYYAKSSSGEVVHGRSYWVSVTNGYDIPEGNYKFDETGRMILPEDSAKNGIYAEDDGLFYYVDGVRTYAGLIQLDGDYYYVRSNGQLAVGTYWVTKNNGLEYTGKQEFDETGKMIFNTKDGIISEQGSLWYYKDGELQFNAGLIQVGDDYYYIRSNGEVVHGRSYWTTNTNGLLPEASYTFGDDGKMINTPDSSIEKDGIVAENDSLWYYRDGKLQYNAGLIQIEDNYYYVRSNGEVVHGKKYWTTNTNDLMPAKEYTFDADGKMLV